MKRFKKIAIWFTGILILMLIILLVVSPYKEHSNDYKTVEATIKIDSPIDSVFSYMTNSAYASDWSSYVDHITPLNSKDFMDGEEGSIRRVFVSEDEKEPHWDEKIIKVRPNKLRQLAIFNIDGLIMSADGLLTEQRYKKVNANETELSLVLYFDQEKTGLWNEFKMHISSFRIRSIFEKNLMNIKREIEAR